MMYSNQGLRFRETLPLSEENFRKSKKSACLAEQDPVAGNGFQLVQRAAGDVQPASGYHGHLQGYAKLGAGILLAFRTFNVDWKKKHNFGEYVYIKHLSGQEGT